jgi:hypothetical protein
MRICLSIFLASYLFLTIVQKSHAQSSVFSDKFDSPTLDAWTLERSAQWGAPLSPCMNNGVPAAWQVINGMANITISGPACVTEIKPVGLDLQNSEGYEIEFDWRIDTSTHMDRNFALLWKDTQNWIGIKLIDNSLLVQSVQDGYSHIVPGSSVQYAFQANQTYQFRVQYTNNNQVVIFINGEKVVDVIDTELKPYIGSRSFALQASVGSISSSRSSFDNIVVTVPDAPTLGVEHIGQGDEPWGGMEYDTASAWSDGGITFWDWGCALTSAVMIMRYHGITTMPDGQPVNPLSVNNWLLANHGYFNGGLVSFPSISALTKEISTTYGTPTLEYSGTNTEPLEKALTSVDASLPAILQVPGHFVVVEGRVGDSPFDAFIQDPAGSKKQLSLLMKRPASARFFTPSHTDISYLEIAADPATKIELKTASGAAVPAQSSIEQIESAANSGLTSPALQVIEIAKPPVDTYSLSIDVPSESTAPTDIKMIGVTGDTTYYTLPAVDQKVKLSISPDQPGQLLVQDKSGFSTFRKMLKELNDAGKIKHERSYWLLDLVAEQGESATSQTEQRLITTVLRKILNSRPGLTGMDKGSRKQLLNQVKTIDAAVKGKTSPQWVIVSPAE